MAGFGQLARTGHASGSAGMAIKCRSRIRDQDPVLDLQNPLACTALLYTALPNRAGCLRDKAISSSDPRRRSVPA